MTNMPANSMIQCIYVNNMSAHFLFRTSHQCLDPFLVRGWSVSEQIWQLRVIAHAYALIDDPSRALRQARAPRRCSQQCPPRQSSGSSLLPSGCCYSAACACSCPWSLPHSILHLLRLVPAPSHPARQNSNQCLPNIPLRYRIAWLSCRTIVAEGGEQDD